MQVFVRCVICSTTYSQLFNCRFLRKITGRPIQLWKSAISQNVRFNCAKKAVNRFLNFRDISVCGCIHHTSHCGVIWVKNKTGTPHQRCADVIWILKQNILQGYACTLSASLQPHKTPTPSNYGNIHIHVGYLQTDRLVHVRMFTFMYVKVYTWLTVTYSCIEYFPLCLHIY